MKAQRLPRVHVNPDRSGENVCRSKKEDSAGHYASKYGYGTLKMSEASCI